jgi:asparagine synthase (glutamine-hydrolysing)
VTETPAQLSARRPARFDRYLAWRTTFRHERVTTATIGMLAEDADVAVAHPLASPRFVAALAAAGGRGGLGARTSLTRLLFGDLLPKETIERRGKAFYHFAHFRDESRRFAQRWRGEGIDPDLVDHEALRAAWLGRIPDGRSGLLLQAAWLAASHGFPDGPG